MFFFYREYYLYTYPIMCKFKGVSHADDVAFMVTYLTDDMTETPSDAAIAEFLGKMVTDFMKHGFVNERQHSLFPERDWTVS